MRDFPFVSDADRSAWLAALLTPLVRDMYAGPTPWLVAHGNAPGIGKGLLLDVAAIVLSGRSFVRSPWSQAAEVTRRVVTEQVRAGTDAYLFDNMRGRVGNAVIESVLTGTEWADVGVSGTLRTVFFGTGNDIEWVGDTPRRVLPIRLRTGQARPETRSGFHHPRLRQHVLAGRSRLLSAALTVVRAWVLAGRPTYDLPAWGSFEAWSDVVREMLVWVGQPDPLETRAPDPSGTSGSCVFADRRGAVVAAVFQSCARQHPRPPHLRGVTARELVESARASDDGRLPWQVELSAALPALTTGAVTVASVGKLLRDMREHTFGGLRLVQAVSAGGGCVRTRDGMQWTALPAGYDPTDTATWDVETRPEDR